MALLAEPPRLHPALLAAIETFRAAARQGTATVKLASLVANHLKLARHNPSLPFGPAADGAGA